MRRSRRRRQRVVEEEGREGKEHRPGAEEDGRRPAEAGRDALRRQVHQQEQRERRKDSPEEVDLPQPVDIRPGLRGGSMQADGAEGAVPRQGEHREARGLRGVEAAVDVCGVDRLARIDLRGAAREGTDEGVVRGLVPAARRTTTAAAIASDTSTITSAARGESNRDVPMQDA